MDRVHPHLHQADLTVVLWVVVSHLVLRQPQLPAVPHQLHRLLGVQLRPFPIDQETVVNHQLLHHDRVALPSLLRSFRRK